MRKARTQKRLDLTRRLATYSAAVGAGIALSDPASAAVVTSGPIDLNLPFGGGPLSVTMEGILPEMTLAFSTTFGNAITGNGLLQALRANNSFLVLTSGFARRLTYPDMVGTSLNVPGASTGTIGAAGWSASGTSTQGNWAVGDRGFLGFSFLDETSFDTHNGWAYIERTSATGGILHSWAYESLADTPILVPEPSGLALLALGAAGIASFRRRRSQA